jgi:hypothetical protein
MKSGIRNALLLGEVMFFVTPERVSCTWMVYPHPEQYTDSLYM